MRYIRKNDERLFKKPREFWINAVSKWVKNEKARYCIIRNFCDYVPYETIAEVLEKWNKAHKEYVEQVA